MHSLHLAVGFLVPTGTWYITPQLKQSTSNINSICSIISIFSTGGLWCKYTRLADLPGIEPGTTRLTVEGSAAELKINEDSLYSYPGVILSHYEIAITFGFFSSGSSCCRVIRSNPSLSSAPLTTTYSAKTKSCLKSRVAIPLWTASS